MSVSETHRVGPGDTAAALGSGDVEVLGTPRLLAWLEAATVVLARPWLDEGTTTVGTEVRIRHRRPTFVGDTVHIHAESGEPDRNRITFTVRAENSDGTIAADGDIVRAIVPRNNFEP